MAFMGLVMRKRHPGIAKVLFVFAGLGVLVIAGILLFLFIPRA